MRPEGAQIERHHARPQADEGEHVVRLAPDIVGAIRRTPIRTGEDLSVVTQFDVLLFTYRDGELL